MDRKILSFFSKWQVSPIRTPLIVRGARQVGKSHAIRMFGKQNFSHFLEVNLETQPQYSGAFASRQTKEICQQLSALSREKIVPGKTLLFIDEIQSSTDALIALRSFKEDLPELHVISAGSLLEFALEDELAPSFPVGRVSFAYMNPLSFLEFLHALGEGLLVEMVESATIASPVPAPIHARLLELLRVYFQTGGMPEVVETYRLNQNFLDAQRIQNRLVTAFIADFSKYGRKYDYRKLQQILTSAPKLVGKTFKYSFVDKDVKARDLKLPLLDLERAGLLRRVRATSANGLPLGAEEKIDKFKIQTLDIGLMLNSLGLNIFSEQSDNVLFANEGSLAEQFVGQELLTCLDPEQRLDLFYWCREVEGASSEVDFVLQVNNNIIPIEVKARATGSLKSLRQFMLDKKSKLGIRFSQHPLSIQDKLVSIPMYMVQQSARLIESALGVESA